MTCPLKLIYSGSTPDGAPYVSIFGMLVPGGVIVRTVQRCGGGISESSVLLTGVELEKTGELNDNGEKLWKIVSYVK